VSEPQATRAAAEDLAMFVNELRGMVVHLGRRVVNGGRMLMCPTRLRFMASWQRCSRFQFCAAVSR
jgi:hypothetical protein